MICVNFHKHPSVSKSNRLHVDTFQLFFIDVKCIPLDSSEMDGNFPEVLSSNWLFLKLNRFIC
jgi:hypothetical protein